MRGNVSLLPGAVLATPDVKSIYARFPSWHHRRVVSDALLGSAEWRQPLIAVTRQRQPDALTDDIISDEMLTWLRDGSPLQTFQVAACTHTSVERNRISHVAPAL